MTQVKPLTLPTVKRRGQTWTGRVVHIDTFGNLITNLPGALVRGHPARLRYRRQAVRLVDSYHEGRQGEVVAVVGSLGLVELAARGHSAAKRLAAIRGDLVTLQRP
jgi:S-adenosylmethionine hydrolase